MFHLPARLRSQSFDHILSPCKDLLRTAAGTGAGGGSALLSPVRGATPDLLLNDSGYYGSSAVSQATSPRYMSTSVGGASNDAWFGRQRSFHVHQPQGVAGGQAAAAAQRRMPFYHTMSMYSTTQTDDNCNNTNTVSQLGQNSFSRKSSFFVLLIILGVLF